MQKNYSLDPYFNCKEKILNMCADIGSYHPVYGTVQGPQGMTSQELEQWAERRCKAELRVAQDSFRIASEMYVEGSPQMWEQVNTFNREGKRAGRKLGNDICPPPAAIKESADGKKPLPAPTASSNFHIFTPNYDTERFLSDVIATLKGGFIKRTDFFSLPICTAPSNPFDLPGVEPTCKLDPAYGASTPEGALLGSILIFGGIFAPVALPILAGGSETAGATTAIQSTSLGGRFLESVRAFFNIAPATL